MKTPVINSFCACARSLCALTHEQRVRVLRALCVFWEVKL